MDGKKQRSSNIELLRILAMGMIIGHHFAVHSNLAFPGGVSAGRIFVYWLDLGGKVGVDIFVLISGYFLIKSREFRVGKLLKLWGQVAFYSLGLKLLGGLLGFGHPELVGILQALLPVSFTQWWFATTYFVLFLLSPYINVGLNALTKAQYRRLLAVMAVIWCLYPTLLRQNVEGGNLIWFVFLYALAGYLRLFSQDFRWKAGTLFAASGLLLGADLAWAALCAFLDGVRPGVGELATGFFGMDQLPVVAAAVCLLLGFRKLEVPYSPWINRLGGACFGVYLIHDSPVIRYWLWNELLPGQDWVASPWLIPGALAVIAGVFLICAGVDLLRMATAEKLWMKLVDRVEETGLVKRMK
ncbi:MAG: acyltransferase [Oscillospiraceae bacterium]|nr:acyltransferase [Oscillospiraceae bacterium]